VKERNNLEDLGLDRRILLHLKAGCDDVDWILLARVRSNDGLFRPQQWLADGVIKDGKFVSTCHVSDRQLLKMALLHEFVVVDDQGPEPRLRLHCSH
jgi:hypothetical protein